MALQLQQQPIAILLHSSSFIQTHSLFFHQHQQRHALCLSGKVDTGLGSLCISQMRRRSRGLFVGKEDTELRVQEEEEEEEEEKEEEEVPPSPEDLEYINEIKRVPELLKKNCDMLFNELIIMIEDPREVERRRILGIEDPDAPTRDDLVEALEQTSLHIDVEKETQISVDPISLRESSRREASFNFMIPLPMITTQDLPVPPPLPPVKSQLVSCSLPNSASSSPRFSFALLKKKWRNESQASPRQINNLIRRNSAVHPRLLLKKFICAGASLAPMEDHLQLLMNLIFCSLMPGQWKTMTRITEPFTEISALKSAKKIDPSSDDGFKCSAFCLYLPGFGKAKPVRSKREEVEVEETEMGKVISRTVSLEKFECGSWASSAVVNDLHDDGDSSSISLYFDLPLELIKSGMNDTDSPVAAAFMFDKDRKGVLKNSSTKATSSCRKSHESSRHVRFSTSSSTSHPTSPASCITPRLRKAREDFNAFLEAQSS